MTPLNVAIVTVSDRSFRGEREDLTGPALRDFLLLNNWNVSASSIVPDEVEQIAALLRSLCSRNDVDLILTAGGTGFSPRDVTPEATRKVIEKETPGFVIAMLTESLKKTPHAMLSRQAAGICGTKLIINLPGSPTAALENLQVVLPSIPHALKLICSDPNSEAGHKLI